VFQPLSAVYGDSMVRVVSRLDAGSLNIVARYQCDFDGVEIASGELARFKLVPDAKYDLPLAIPECRGNESFLTVSFHLADDQPWAPAGYEVAWEQYQIPSIQKHQIPAMKFHPASAEDLPEIILAGPTLNVWRAPLENDFRFEKVCRERGIDKLSAKSCDNRTHWLNTAGELLFTDKFDYQTNGNRIKLTHCVEPADNLPTLLRLGVRLTLPGNLTKATWYGRGPHETLCDRAYGARVGLFTDAIDSLSEPYVFPQENGMRVDCRWLKLTDESGTGLLVSGCPTFTWSARRCTVEDLDAALHLHDLPRRDTIELCLDWKQAGTGNTALRAERLPHYLVQARPIEWSFMLEDVKGG